MRWVSVSFICNTLCNTFISNTGGEPPSQFAQHAAQVTGFPPSAARRLLQFFGKRKWPFQQNFYHILYVFKAIIKNRIAKNRKSFKKINFPAFSASPLLTGRVQSTFKRYIFGLNFST